MSVRSTVKSLIPAQFHPALRRAVNSLLLRDIFVDRMRIRNIWRDTGYMHTLALNEEECRELEDIYGIRFSYIKQELNKQIEDFSNKVKYPELLKVIPEGSRVLDLGCGPGVTLWDLKRQKNADVCGLDISQGSVDILRERGIEAYRCNISDLFDERLQWAAQQNWDYVISCGGALQNFNWPTKILQIFGSSTQVHQVYNTGFWFYRLRLLFGRFSYIPTTDLMTKGHPYFAEVSVFRTYWTLKDFEQICASVGLEAEMVSHRGWRFFGTNIFIHNAFYVLRQKNPDAEVTIADVIASRDGEGTTRRLGANAW